MSFAPDPYAGQIAVPFEVFAEPTPVQVPRQTSTMAGLAIKLLLSLLLVVVVLAALIGFVMYQRYTKNRSIARVQQPEPAKAAEPPDELSRLTIGDTGKPTTEELRQKTANLQTSLAYLVAAMAKRDIPGAEFLVAQARANAHSPNDQKTVDKYEKLSQDVREFWRIIKDRVSKFKPSEEVTLGKTRVIVVEAQDGRFSIKYGSKIFNYTVETMPTWLVTAMADSSLTRDSASKEFYGAFLAVDPEGDRSRARALWSEAANTGVKIDQLLPSLDSLPPTQKQ
jgi:hypothetical protein